jgi:hypothetical protein
MRTVRIVCCLALLAGALVCRLDRANAQGSDAAREACTPDAVRLCSDVIPDVAKVTACMHAKASELSAACRIAMAGGAAPAAGGKSAGHYYRRGRYCRHSRHC